jgi:hypothetical protein
MGTSRQEAPTGKPAVLAAWTLPLIVAAIAVSIVAGFYLGGPGLGMAVGALAASSIIVMAVRRPPRYPIVPAALGDFRRHLLVVLSEPLEDAEAIEQIARATHREGQPEAEVVVLTPARHGFLDRWTSDLGPAVRRAQRCLMVSVASLAKVDVVAAARMGDEDLVQAVEDELRTFPATDVILVSGDPERDASVSAVAQELKSRLEIEFHHLVLGSAMRPGDNAGGPRAAPPSTAGTKRLITSRR